MPFDVNIMSDIFINLDVTYENNGLLWTCFWFIYGNLKSLRKVLLKNYLTTLVKVNQSDFRTSGKAANLKKKFPLEKSTN